MHRLFYFVFLVLGFSMASTLAVAQDAAAAAPSGAPWVFALPALVIAIVAFLRAVLAPKYFPAWLEPLLDLIAQNFGHARNDPNGSGR